VAKKVATLGISSVDVEEDPLRVCSMGAEGLEFFLLVGEETGTTSQHSSNSSPLPKPPRKLKKAYNLELKVIKGRLFESTSATVIIRSKSGT